MLAMLFWVRWSWRDLRARWIQVVAVALIIAFGTGIYAGLGGQATWRIDSLNASTALLNMYDIKMELTDGSYVEGAALRQAMQDIPGVKAFEVRLLMPTLVDASSGDDTVLVQGRLVGVEVTGGGPHVNGIYISDGRSLNEADSGQPVAIVEYKFAREHGLHPGDPLRISGDVALQFVGTGHSPEYFQIIPENGGFMAESSYAVIFVPLETAQQLAGRAGLVNDLSILIADGADQEAVRAEVERRMQQAFPDIGFTFTSQHDDPGIELLYTDAKGDQDVWNLVALLFLIGAAFGTFNLAGRMVESQRRQIGIGMALGVPRQWLAFRPMLVGIQIAVLGTLLGLILGWVFSQVFAGLLEDLLPLPVWEVGLYIPAFLRAMALGILMPVSATLIPVVRAVRVPPIDAIKSGHLIAKSGGLTWLINRLPLPGRSFMQMPFKNSLRAPWRTWLTVLGIGMAVVLLVMFVGFMDSFEATVKRGEAAYAYQGADRIEVNLDTFYPVDSERMMALANLTGPDGQPLFAQVDTTLLVGGDLIQGDTQIEILLQVQDMQDAIWVPDLIEGSLVSDQPGLIISRKAAQDLGVEVGDPITLKHPLRGGLLAFRFVESEIRVIGIHNNPMRVLTYMAPNGAALMGLDGLTNQLVVMPGPGVSIDTVKRALFTQPGVTSVVAATQVVDLFREALEVFTAVLVVVELVVILMAFLIAFNSTSINVDERVREIATMFAFGLPVRTVTRMQVVENLIVGLLGTAVGVLLGWIALNELLAARVEEQLADLELIVTVSPVTLAISLLLGVLTVALTPLLSIRKMLNMNIPSTLRVME